MAENKKILSIQFSLDGLYYLYMRGKECDSGFVSTHNSSVIDAMLSIPFWFDDSFQKANIIVDTGKVCLVPYVFFVRGVTYLDKSDIIISPNETEVGGNMINNICPAMGLRHDILDMLSSRFQQLHFYSPIQVNILRSTANTIYVNVADNAYITVTDRALHHAEVLPVKNDEDILYYILQIQSRMKTKGMQIKIEGQGSERLFKMLKKHFPKVSHEGLTGKTKEVSEGEFNLRSLCYADNKR